MGSVDANFSNENDFDPILPFSDWNRLDNDDIIGTSVSEVFQKVGKLKDERLKRLSNAPSVIKFSKSKVKVGWTHVAELRKLLKTLFTCYILRFYREW